VPFISKTLDTAKYSFLACRLSIMTFNAIFVCIKCSKELDADAKIELHPCRHTVRRDCLIVCHAKRGAETLTCSCLSEVASHTWTCQPKTPTRKRTRATAKLDDYDCADSELQCTACAKGSHPIWDAQRTFFRELNGSPEKEKNELIDDGVWLNVGIRLFRNKNDDTRHHTMIKTSWEVHGI